MRAMPRPFRRLAPALLVSVLAAAALTACDRTLETEPYDRVPAGQEIVDAATAQAALTGAYDALQSGGYYGLDLELLGDLPSDNGRWAGTYQFLGEIADNQITGDNPEVEAMWTAIYQQVDRDNVVLQRVPQVAGIPEDVKAQLTGEAYFMRALSFHNLVKFWGAVPTPLVPAASADVAAGYTRAAPTAVYSQILSDLTQAEQLLSAADDATRATPDAVRALRARVLLYRATLPGADASADYQGALDAAESVLAGRDTLTVPYPDLFSAVGTSTSEDIFRVSFTSAESNSLGYYWLNAGRHEAAPTTDLGDAYEDGDVRKDWTVRPRSSGSSRLQGTKFPTTIGAEHPHVIRLAELVLIKAEVLARQGALVDAVAEYNKVRVRAGLAPHALGADVATQADVLAAIDQERRVELALEGDRWPDLVRTGRAAAVKDFEDRPGQALFPIPTREILTAPGLTQNPGY